MKSFMARQRQDGFVTVRFKSAAGKLTTAQLLAINELAEKFGDGFITLTSRQEISIPFIKKEDFDAVERFCAENGLQISPIGTILKQVTACQGLQSCPIRRRLRWRLSGDLAGANCLARLRVR